jgi:hypothetical protein
MGSIDANRLGVVLAAVMAAWHVVWSLLVAFGQGQRVMDFVFKMHGLRSDVVVEPFDAGMAMLLAVVAAVAGYVVGAGAGLVWNGLAVWAMRGKTGIMRRAS